MQLINEHLLSRQQLLPHARFFRRAWRILKHDRQILNEEHVQNRTRATPRKSTWMWGRITMPLQGEAFVAICYSSVGIILHLYASEYEYLQPSEWCDDPEALLHPSLSMRLQHWRIALRGNNVPYDFRTNVLLTAILAPL